MALPAGEVHVWCADPSHWDSAAHRRTALSLLARDESARLNKFRLERDRRIFLATRVLVRTVLSKYESVSPVDWRFTVNAYGRPSVFGAAEWLNFNLANTHGLVVCAVAREIEVGVDVENIEGPAPVEVADRFFANREIEALRALPESERSARFFDYWTLKESYIKARGMGLALPLDGFAFSLEEGHPPRITMDAVLDDEASWEFVQLRPTPAHLVSLCVRRRGDGERAVVVLRWQTLLAA
jgi:4'-phosphopantetheinyl transferase